jgi:hypothetical protein
MKQTISDIKKIAQIKISVTSWKVAGSRPNEVNFFNLLILPAVLGPGVHSASNRNEYQKHKNNKVSVE